jgi:hypothetical protein
MPPVMITNVVPSATVPITTVLNRMLVTLEVVAKLSLENAKNAKMTIRLAKASSCWSRSLIADPRPGGLTVSVGGRAVVVMAAPPFPR